MKGVKWIHVKIIFVKWAILHKRGEEGYKRGEEGYKSKNENCETDSYFFVLYEKTQENSIYVPKVQFLHLYASKVILQVL